jgi:hypothetical protein
MTTLFFYTQNTNFIYMKIKGGRRRWRRRWRGKWRRKRKAGCRGEKEGGRRGSDWV